MLPISPFAKIDQLPHPKHKNFNEKLEVAQTYKRQTHAHGYVA